MKKIYILPLFFVFASQVNAQSNSKNYSFGQQTLSTKVQKANKTAKPTTSNSEKALTILWSEDFTVTSGTTTANGAYTAAGANASYWAMGTFAHPLAAVVSGLTVGLTGDFLKWDSYNPNSNEVNFATTSVFGEIESPTIDLSASATANNLGIQFNTQAAYCCNFQVKPFYIAFSEDNGATWTAPVALDFGVSRNELTEDIAVPLEFSMNITSYVSSASSQFKFKFIWDGGVVDPNGQYNTHYSWLIDDVEIFELPAIDALVESSYYGSVGLYYDQIPSTQIAPIDFSANILNNGSADLTNVVFGIDVNSGGTVLTSTPQTITAGTTDSLFTTAFTPAGTGAYSVVRSLTHDGVDELPGNNVLSDYTFTVGDFIYARDNNVADGYENNATGANAGPFETGPFYDIFADQDVYGLNYRLATGTPVGAEIYGRLYKVVAGDFEYVQDSETQFYQVTAADLGTMKRLPFIVPISLTAGDTYVAVIGSFDGAVRVATAGASDPQTSFIYTEADDTWYFVLGTPMVRLDFDPSIGLDENSILSNVNIYPNPANTEAQVSFNLANSSNVTINVTDITGKTVESITVNNAAAGAGSANLNVSNYAAGVYNVLISSNEGSVTKKFIKN